MAQRVEKHLTLYRVLVDTTDVQRVAILRTLTPSQLRAVLEAIYNVLRGACPVDDTLKKKLHRHKKVIRILSRW